MSVTSASPKLSYGINDAAAAIGISRPTIYRLIAAGELTCFKVGSRTLIRADVLEGFLARKSQG